MGSPPLGDASWRGCTRHFPLDRSPKETAYAGERKRGTRSFVVAMQGQVDSADLVPLYLRPLAILVRPGNPKGITGFKDLLKPGVSVMVVQGAGQIEARRRSAQAIELNAMQQLVAGRRAPLARSIRRVKPEGVAGLH